jgi:hypothetical protein
MGATLGPKAVRQIEEIARRVLGETRNEGGHRARYTGPPINVGLILAKTTTTHSSGSTKPVQRYTGISSPTTMGPEVDAKNFFSDLTSGHWVLIAPVNGAYVLVAADPC